MRAIPPLTPGDSVVVKGQRSVHGTAHIAINGTEQTFPPAIPADKNAMFAAMNRPRIRQ